MNKLNFFSGIVIVILLVMAGELISKYKEYNEFGNLDGMLLHTILLILIFFWIGISLEGKRLLGLFKTKAFKINWCSLAVTIVIIVLVIIPSGKWIVWFGLDSSSFYAPLLQPEIKAVLTVISGVLLVRSFGKINQ